MVVQEGAPASGISGGVNFGTISSPTFNDNDRIAFNASLVGTGAISANDEGIWRTTSGTSLELIAREGDHAPGTPVGDNFLLPGSPVLNSAGHLAFSGSLSGPDITADNKYGIWSDRSGPTNARVPKRKSSARAPTWLWI